MYDLLTVSRHFIGQQLISRSRCHRVHSCSCLCSTPALRRGSAIPFHHDEWRAMGSTHRPNAPSCHVIPMRLRLVTLSKSAYISSQDAPQRTSIQLRVCACLEACVLSFPVASVDPCNASCWHCLHYGRRFARKRPPHTGRSSGCTKQPLPNSPIAAISHRKTSRLAPTY